MIKQYLYENILISFLLLCLLFLQRCNTMIPILMHGCDFTCTLLCYAGLRYAAYAAYNIINEKRTVRLDNKTSAQNTAETMNPETPWVEESREFFGLAINYFYLKNIVRRLEKRVEKLKSL